MEYYSALRKEILPTATTWMNLGGIMPDTERKTLHDLTYMWDIKKSNTWKQRVEQWLSEMGSGENGKMLVKGTKL